MAQYIVFITLWYYFIWPGLTKVLFANSQYMIVYDCVGGEANADGVCPPENEEVEVWGRSTRIGASALAMLTEVGHSRTCATMDDFVLADTNRK